MDIFKRNGRNVISLSIGENALQIGLFSLSKGKIKLLKYEIKDFGGALQDEDNRLRKFVNDFITRNSIKEKNVVIDLQDPDSFIMKRIRLSGIPEPEVREAIKLELKGEAPFDLEQAQIDWQVIDEYTDEEGAKTKEFSLACAKIDLIDKYIQVVKDAGLKVVDIKLTPFSFSHLLEKIETLKKGIVSILDIRAANCTFLIYKDSKLSFSRNLPFSIKQVIAGMSGTLISDTSKIEFTKERAEEIIKKFGIPEGTEQLLEDGIKGGRIMALIRPTLERLTREIIKSIDYYVSSYESKAPKTLYVTGSGPDLKGLDRYLGNEIGFNVDRLPLSNIVDVNEGADREKFGKDTAGLADLAGAVLGLNKRPNFLPLQHKTEKMETIEKISLRLMGLTAALIFSFSFFIVNYQVNGYGNKLNNAKLRLQAMNQAYKLHKRIIERQNLVGKIKSNRIPPHWILKELGNLMPANVVLQAMELDHEDKFVILGGYLTSRRKTAQGVLTTFMKNMEASLFFGEASLRSLESKEYGEKEVTKFEIRCELVK